MERTDHRSAGPELAVERAVRAAARAGNRLLAGGVADVAVSDPRTRELLLVALARMGVRGPREAEAPAEFVFRDRTDDGGGAALGAGGLPPVVVGLDGGVASARDDGAGSRIAWAARGMRATAALAARLRAGREGEGVAPRIAVSLVLEPKTAALVLALAEAGCEVALFSAVSETDPEVAAALAADGRVAVFAPTADCEDPDEARRADAAHAAGVLDWRPDYLVDDGAHLIRLAHTEHPEALATLRGAAEETTSGVRPLREMAAEGALRIPVIAVNDARTKTGFDNLVGTGQSCVFAAADLLDAAAWGGPGAVRAVGGGYRGAAGTRWAVIGYGPVGVGTARFAAALGARVTVVERDPVRALAALHDGFEARSAAEALPGADVVVSATGVWHTLDAAGFARLRPGTAVAVAGGIDDELALDELRAEGWGSAAVVPGVDEWTPPGADRGVLVLAGGGGVNYTASEGNPIEVMDLSFATQIAALMRLMRDELPAGVHALSTAEEHLVARAALATRGADADPAPSDARPGGAAQPWTVHRYRASAPSDGAHSPDGDRRSGGSRDPGPGDDHGGRPVSL
ncbi:adenosylhomocysteinase [Leucobacter sp.]